MTMKKKMSAEFLAGLEGDAVPFAAAPRHVSGGSPKLDNRAGNQVLAISSVHEMVLQALLATGYETTLAESMAAVIAESVPTVQKKVQSAA